MFGDAPYGAPPAPTGVPDYMVQSVLVTLCFPPLGIAGIVFSSQAKAKQRAGDHTGATEAAGKAKRSCLIALIVGPLLWVAFFAWALLANPTNGIARDDSGAIQGEGGDLDVFDVQVGDCIAGFFSDEGDDSEVQSVRGVACSEPHDLEVSHTFDLPKGDYPGDAVVEETGTDECEEAFEDYVGIRYSRSELATGPLLRPTEESWNVGGDREVVCGVTSQDGRPSRGSVRDSGR